MAQNLNLLAERGDDFLRYMVFKKNGVVVDITLWKIYFTLKSKQDDTDEKAVIKKDITEHIAPLEGKSLLHLLPAETNVLNGVYFYDFQLKDNLGVILTFLKGTLTFGKDITRRTNND